MPPAAAAADLYREIRPPLSEEEAVLEASRCLECGRGGREGRGRPAPCIAACPTHIDIPKFIREIREGRPLDAAETIFEANALGGTCARVCPVEELCEGACVLVHEGRRAVAIGRLQRYATDRAFAEKAVVHPLRKKPKNPLSVGVIGAGPAGLACAAELAQLGHEVTVYEAREGPGGLVVTAVAPYKQMIDPLPQEVEAIRRLGVHFEFHTRIGEDVPRAELERRHEALFLGVGLDGDVRPRLGDEEETARALSLEGVWLSLAFIERVKAKSPPPLGPRVVIVGGGNTAIDCAREAVRLGAPHVTVLYRRTEAEMPAFRHEVEAAREEGVRFEWLTLPVKLLGDVHVEAVECVRTRLVKDPKDGRPRPEIVEGTEFTIPADTVIWAIGQRPRTDLLQALGVELENGVVKVDEHFRTSHPGIFAGGDCINGGGTVVEAVEHGKRAARAIDALVKPRSRRSRSRPARRGPAPPVKTNPRGTRGGERREGR